MSKLISLANFPGQDEIDILRNHVTEIIAPKLFNFNEIVLESSILKEFMEQSKYIIPELFLHPGGIHGVNHAKRVLFLCLTLSHLYDIDDADKQILVEASKFHDIGRINDEDCELHGYLSVRKVMEQGLLCRSKDLDIQILKYIIENHCISDKNALKRVNNYAIRNKEKAAKLLKLFKDADALDRVRTNDLDISYLRFAYSKRLLKVSRQLFSLMG